MNKKLIAYLLVSCISLFLPYNPVNAAVKAGGVCIKAGLTSVASNKTYTCVKSGKRLVWNKGTTTAPPVAVQPPWLKGYSEISSISRNNKIDFNLEEIEISSHVDTKLVGNLLKYQNLVSSYWKSYGFESQYPIHILILSEKDYPTYLKHYASCRAGAEGPRGSRHSASQRSARCAYRLSRCAKRLVASQCTRSCRTIEPARTRRQQAGL